MKILYLHQYFKTPSMSGGTRSYEMARRMVSRGHEVHMITTRQGSGVRGWAVEDVDGIHVHWLELAYDNQMSYVRRILSFFVFAFRSSARAVRVGGDVVFATSTPLTIAVPGVLASKLRRAPMVFEVRDLWPELPIAMGALGNPVLRWLARRLELFAYRNSVGVIALSPGMADGVINTGYPPERVTVVPNSCDRSMFEVPEEAGRAFRRERDWLVDRPLVTYAGTLGAINGVGYLVEVAREMIDIDPEIRFMVVGAGAEADVVRDKAEKAGVLGRNFFMEGPLPKESMPRLFSAATICTSLFLPLKEMEANSANKFFDALAAARPVAINYGGWQAEIIQSERVGLVMNPLDAAQAARQLAAFIDTPGALSQARKRAASMAETVYSRDVLAQRLIKRIESAAAASANDLEKEVS